MMFPDVSPSRHQVFGDLANALSGQSTRIYLDASLLIRSYEVSIAARDELLAALEKFGDRVAVPVWAARETWEYVRKRIPRRPLQAASSRLKNDLRIFRTAVLRFVDDDTLKDVTKAEYQKQLDDALEAVGKLAALVANHEPASDVTTARLMPFIDSRRLNSDLSKILDVVERTGASRVVHEVPPGFADSGAPDTSGDDRSARPKGKQRNQFGDLINWLEALDDCLAKECEQLIFVTSDVKKDDWVYIPDKVMDEHGRPQKNAGLVTMPLPLLVHEAHKTCPKLKGLHIVSLEMFAHVLQRYLRMPVPNLAAAIQAVDDEREPVPMPAASVPARVDASDQSDIPPTFTSADMNYGFTRGDDIDALLRSLSVEGWRAQNQAVRDIEPLIHRAVRDQLVQIGRGLAGAANDGALEPVEFLRRVFTTSSLNPGVRSNILVGVLAQIYVADTGELQKPVSHPELTAFIYERENDGALSAAYAAVLDRLEPQRRTYLGLPTDHAGQVALVFTLEGRRLSALSTNGAPLFEADAPPSRALRRLGPMTSWSVAELVSELAREFVVPPEILLPDLPNTMQLQVPENTGYVRWGPNTGALLR